MDTRLRSLAAIETRSIKAKVTQSKCTQDSGNHADHDPFSSFDHTCQTCGGTGYSHIGFVESTSCFDYSALTRKPTIRS